VRFLKRWVQVCGVYAAIGGVAYAVAETLIWLSKHFGQDYVAATFLFLIATIFTAFMWDIDGRRSK
jgi:putative flippase GtrA